MIGFHAHEPASIHSLPTELLIYIFDYVYRGKSHNFVDMEPLPALNTLFSVCVRWDTIIQSLPIFWTHAKIFVDSDPTPLSRVRSYFECSRHLPIDVDVLRRQETYDAPDASEYDYCRAVIDIMAPHLARCRTISFNVINSSSLPSISKDFRSPAPLLRRLELKCRLDDGVSSGGPSVAQQSPGEDHFHSPQLYDIAIDGRNFAHACLEFPSWLGSIQPARREDGLIIALSNFTPSPSIANDQQFTLGKFLSLLAPLPLLYSLSLNDVQFPYDSDADDEEYAIAASDLKLENITYDFLTHLLMQMQFSDLERAYVSRCSLGDSVAPNCNELHLANVDEDESIGGFLRYWAGSGTFLQIENCPGLKDDDFISITTSPFALTGNKYLHFTNCPNVTVPGLMQMVKDLNENSIWVIPGSPAVGSLVVDGEGPKPTNEELQWLWDNTEEVDWYATPRVVSSSN